MVEMRMGEQDRIDLTGSGSVRQTILNLALPATLKHSGIDQHSRLTGLDDVSRSSNLATCSPDHFNLDVVHVSCDRRRPPLAG